MEFFLLEETEYVGKYSDFFQGILNDFDKLDQKFPYIFPDKYIIFSWGENIDSKIRELNINKIYNNPDLDYYKKRQEMSDENEMSQDYFINLFNTLNKNDIGSLMKEAIHLSPGGHNLAIVSPYFFQFVIQMGYIADINMNVQFHIGLTNNVLNNNTFFINNDINIRYYIRYDYEQLVEASYISSQDDNNEYSKISFFPNGLVKYYESSSSTGIKSPHTFFTYLKYEKDVFERYNRLYLEIREANFGNNFTLCNIYQSGNLISSIKY